MKRNLNYRVMRRRDNPIKQTIIGLLSIFSSYPRLLIEVFIRKDFGERYFNWGAAIFAVVLFSLLPYWFYTIGAFVGLRHPSTMDFMKQYALWYLYLAAALFMSYKRWQEMRRVPGVFDFARYSLSRGTINPFFFNLPIFKKRPSMRIVEIFIEPGLFFLIGILLKGMGQSVGTLLIICSISYCFSYWSDYNDGDELVMNLIDKKIRSEDMERDFLENEDEPYNPRGAYMRMRRPQSRRDREIIIDAMTDEDDDTAVAV